MCDCCCQRDDFFKIGPFATFVTFISLCAKKNIYKRMLHMSSIIGIISVYFKRPHTTNQTLNFPSFFMKNWKLINVFRTVLLIVFSIFFFCYRAEQLRLFNVQDSTEFSLATCSTRPTCSRRKNLRWIVKQQYERDRGRYIVSTVCAIVTTITKPKECQWQFNMFLNQFDQYKPK